MKIQASLDPDLTLIETLTRTLNQRVVGSPTGCSLGNSQKLLYPSALGILRRLLLPSPGNRPVDPKFITNPRNIRRAHGEHEVDTVPVDRAKHDTANEPRLMRFT